LIPKVPEFGAADDNKVSPTLVQSDDQGIEERGIVGSRQLLRRHAESCVITFASPVSFPWCGLDLDSGDFFAVVSEREHVRSNIDMRDGGIALPMKKFADDRHLPAAASECGA
jgi:hypothetical protein